MRAQPVRGHALLSYGGYCCCRGPVCQRSLCLIRGSSSLAVSHVRWSRRPRSRQAAVCAPGLQASEQRDLGRIPRRGWGWVLSFFRSSFYVFMDRACIKKRSKATGKWPLKFTRVAHFFRDYFLPETTRVIGSKYS